MHLALTNHGIRYSSLAFHCATNHIQLILRTAKILNSQLRIVTGGIASRAASWRFHENRNEKKRNRNRMLESCVPTIHDEGYVVVNGSFLVANKYIVCALRLVLKFSRNSRKIHTK